METIIGLFGNLWNLLAGFGGVVAVGCGVWAGIQFMLAQGDPQKVAQARMGIIGTVAGLIIMGVAFVLPGIISEEVVEPAGGATLVNTEAASCDNTFRNQLRSQTAASTADRMTAVRTAIQLRDSDCAPDIWAPVIGAARAAASGVTGIGCGTATMLGGVTIPSTIRQGGSGTGILLPASIRNTPGRDANGNIVVHFAHAPESRPGDNAVCWLYNAALNTWLISTADASS